METCHVLTFSAYLQWCSLNGECWKNLPKIEQDCEVLSYGLEDAWDKAEQWWIYETSLDAGGHQFFRIIQRQLLSMTINVNLVKSFSPQFQALNFRTIVTLLWFTTSYILKEMENYTKVNILSYGKQKNFTYCYVPYIYQNEELKRKLKVINRHSCFTLLKNCHGKNDLVE